MPAPCEIEILPDGTCAFGMPETLPENQLAIRVWSDMQALGWDAAIVLNDIEVTATERDDLLVKLRFLASEVADQERRRSEERARKGSRRG